MRIEDNPALAYHRTMKVTLGSYSDPNAWDFITDPQGNDQYIPASTTRTIDPVNKLFLPNPLFIVVIDTWF